MSAYTCDLRAAAKANRAKTQKEEEEASYVNSTRFYDFSSDCFHGEKGRESVLRWELIVRRRRGELNRAAKASPGA